MMDRLVLSILNLVLTIVICIVVVSLLLRFGFLESGFYQKNKIRIF